VLASFFGRTIHVDHVDVVSTTTKLPRDQDDQNYESNCCNGKGDYANGSKWGKLDFSENGVIMAAGSETVT
jgi:hypothetical protein